MEFSGKELIQGEPDASSFPSGGLRATFEARGYTAWDPTSYAFIKDSVLCIPTAFCSYGGEALDKKTPLLRSMEALYRQALRVLRLFGNTTATRVLHHRRPGAGVFPHRPATCTKSAADLIYTGRTLFGAKPPKGQEMDDHYFGTDEAPGGRLHARSWTRSCGSWASSAKTEHNEAAPAQHELAPVYHHRQHRRRPQPAHHGDHAEGRQAATAWSACCTKSPLPASTARGKHNNWSIATDTGMNLLEPGETPARERAVPALPLRRHQGRGRATRTCCASPWPPPATTTASAPARRPPPSFPCSLATSSPAMLEAIEPTDAPTTARKRSSDRRSASTSCPASPRTPRTATAPRPLPSPATSSSSACSAPPAPSPAANIVLNTAVAEELQAVRRRAGGRREDFESAAPQASSAARRPRAQAHHLQRQRL